MGKNTADMGGCQHTSTIGKFQDGCHKVSGKAKVRKICLNLETNKKDDGNEVDQQ